VRVLAISLGKHGTVIVVVVYYCCINTNGFFRLISLNQIKRKEGSNTEINDKTIAILFGQRGNNLFIFTLPNKPPFSPLFFI
jgi:hypothetical protein